MNRRQVIKNLGLSAGVVVAVPSLLPLFSSCEANEEPWVPQFFPKGNSKFIMQLTDIILPKHDILPSGTSLKTHEAVDGYIAEVVSIEEMEILKKGYANFLDKLKASLSLEDLNGIKDEDLKSYVDGLYDSEEAQEPTTKEEMMGTAIDFYKTFKHFLLKSYRKSEYIGEKVLFYLPIPGEYLGCVDLLETTQGRSWSL